MCIINRTTLYFPRNRESKTMKEIICKKCNKVFYRHKSRKARFCSSTCANSFRTRKCINTFKKEDEETNYWAGFLFGDGCIRKNKLQVCLGIKDVCHLEKLSYFIFGENFVNRYEDRCHLQVNSEEISRNLRRYGISENKTKSSTLVLPSVGCSDFIRGYFDADGWVLQKKYKHKNGKYYDKFCLGVCSHLRENLEIINSELPHLGNISKNKNKELYSLRITSKANFIETREFLYGPTNLKRKWADFC